jgi:hypothetical protein
MAPQSAAGTANKTFDFGAGGDNPSFRSHARSFTVPQGVAIVVAVNYRTTGENLIPIVVEIEDNSDKTLLTKELVADKSSKRIVLNIAAAENRVPGCEKPWQVRVRTQFGEVPAARVFGDISFSFVDPSPFSIEIGGESYKLNNGEQMTKQFGAVEVFNHPGVINLKAGWLDSLAVKTLPLMFEIVRPDGTLAKSLIGYATNSTGNPKLDFSYNISNADARQKGAWHLKISNETDHDIIEINPKVIYTKKCMQ